MCRVSADQIGKGPKKIRMHGMRILMGVKGSFRKVKLREHQKFKQHQGSAERQLEMLGPNTRF